MYEQRRMADERRVRLSPNGAQRYYYEQEEAPSDTLSEEGRSGAVNPCCCWNLKDGAVTVAIWSLVSGGYGRVRRRAG